MVFVMVWCRVVCQPAYLPVWLGADVPHLLIGKYFWKAEPVLLLYTAAGLMAGLCGPLGVCTLRYYPIALHTTTQWHFVRFWDDFFSSVVQFSRG